MVEGIFNFSFNYIVLQYFIKNLLVKFLLIYLYIIVTLVGILK